MTREDAMKLTEKYARPVFGFALKRCKTEEDAEDLSQDIILKVYTAFTSHSDIEEPDRFVWTVAHNALANYYRGISRAVVGIPMEDAENSLTDEGRSMVDDIILGEDTDRLRREIAYLSATRRRILIAHYYEGQPVAAIARELSLPEGTVKWHLFEAKRDLRKGMETMRQTSELKFNPIKFEYAGTSGNSTTRKAEELLRSTLSQNIVYCVWQKGKSIGEIADDLGVSPVYIESEAEVLEEYGILIRKGSKYYSGVVIDEMTDDIADIQDEVYDSAVALIADEMYDAVVNSGIIDDDRIWGGYDAEISFTSDLPRNRNFYLWSLVPFVIGNSYKEREGTISFDEAMTERPDGGKNIIYAAVTNPSQRQPKYTENMKNWFGMTWLSQGKSEVWRIDSEWSTKRVKEFDPAIVIPLIDRFSNDDELSVDELALLSQYGILQYVSDGKYTKSHYGCLWIKKSIRGTLEEIGRTVRSSYEAELDLLRERYAREILKNTPDHLKKVQKFLLQYVFSSDGYFLYACLRHLVDTGKLKVPEGEERRYVSTIVIE